MNLVGSLQVSEERCVQDNTQRILAQMDEEEEDGPFSRMWKNIHVCGPRLIDDISSMTSDVL